MFMATSREPSAAPKAKSVIPRETGEPATTSNGNRAASPEPPARMIGRLPYLAFRAPVRNIKATEPTPRQSNSRPSVPSSTWSLSLAKGTRGAQQATPKPATRKESRVASRVSGRSAFNKTKLPRCSCGTAGRKNLAAGQGDFAERVCIGVMLDDEYADVLEFGDAMWRPRAELLGGGEDDIFLAGRQQRALESGVGQFVGADARRGGNCAGPDEAEVDVHLRDARSRERVDAPADAGGDRAADHDEPQVGPSQSGGGYVDRVCRKRQFVVFRQAGDERQIGAAAVEKHKLTRLCERRGFAGERELAVAALFHARSHR